MPCLSLWDAILPLQSVFTRKAGNTMDVNPTFPVGVTPCGDPGQAQWLNRTM